MADAGFDNVSTRFPDIPPLAAQGEQIQISRQKKEQRVPFTKYVLIFRNKIRIAHFVSMSAYIRSTVLSIIQSSQHIVTENDRLEGIVVSLGAPDHAFQFAPTGRKHP